MAKIHKSVNGMIFLQGKKIHIKSSTDIYKLQTCQGRQKPAVANLSLIYTSPEERFSFFGFCNILLLVHFLVSHDRSPVHLPLLPSQPLTDLVRSKPNQVLTASRHPRRSELVVDELLATSLVLLPQRIVVLVLEVDQARPTAVAHGDFAIPVPSLFSFFSDKITGRLSTSVCKHHW